MTLPTEPVHPGKILFDQAMKPLGVSRNKLARDIDVPVGRISDIVAGKRGVTPDTALRLAKYFGTSAELWMRLQSEFDLHVVRTTSWLETEPRVRAYQPPAGQAGAAIKVPAVAIADASVPAGTEPAEHEFTVAVTPTVHPSVASEPLSNQEVMAETAMASIGGHAAIQPVAPPPTVANDVMEAAPPLPVGGDSPLPVGGDSGPERWMNPVDEEAVGVLDIPDPDEPPYSRGSGI